MTRFPPSHRTGLRFVLLGLCLLATTASPADEVRLTFLHFNDVYEYRAGVHGGGLARLGSLIQTERERDPQALASFGGDLISPSVASSVTRGAHMIDFLNRYGLDAAVPGNHEFDFGAAVFRARITESRFPWLAGNIDEASGEPFAGLPRWRIVERRGLHVGYFALLTAQTANLSSGGREAGFRPETAQARVAVAELRAAGADVIVALTHLDLADDERLVREVPGIDLVLGGHDHQPLAIDTGPAPIIKAGHDGEFLAVVELAVDPALTGPDRVRLAGWQLRASRDAEPLPGLVTLEQRYAAEVDAALQAPIATLDSPLDSRESLVRSREAAIGNLYADALRAYFDADVALLNGGGLRGRRAYAAGTVLTRSDVLRELPFGNTVMLLDVSGADLRAALEHGLSAVPAPAGRFPQIAGMRVEYDPAAPGGQRLRQVMVGTGALEPARRYRLATTDFLADGGDGYAMLREGRVLVDRSAAPLLANVVSAALAAAGRVQAIEDGRLRAIPPVTTH